MNTIADMALPIQLKKPSLYLQPETLCGPACLLASHHILSNSFVEVEGAFRQNVLSLAQGLKSQNLASDGLAQGPVTLDEIFEVSRRLVDTKIFEMSKLKEICVQRKPEFVLLKTKWRDFDKLVSGRKLCQFLEHPEREHYILIINKRESSTLCWEPSFSGPDGSPILQTTWETLLEGNSQIRYQGERGKALAIYSTFKLR